MVEAYVSFIIHFLLGLVQWSVHGNGFGFLLCNGGSSNGIARRILFYGMPPHRNLFTSILFLKTISLLQWPSLFLKEIRKSRFTSTCRWCVVLTSSCFFSVLFLICYILLRMFGTNYVTLSIAYLVQSYFGASLTISTWNCELKLLWCFSGNKICTLINNTTHSCSNYQGTSCFCCNAVELVSLWASLSVTVLISQTLLFY
jgi:hypothetical protein